MSVDSRGRVVSWDTATGSILRYFDVGTPRFASFSKDGQRLAVAGKGIVTTWNTNTNQQIGTLRTGALNKVAISRDGQRIACADGNSNRITVWNSDTVQGPRRFPVQMGIISQVSFNSDGRRLTVAGVVKQGSDDSEVAVKLYAPATGQELQQFVRRGTGGLVYRVTCSSDGQRMATFVTGVGGLMLWDRDSGDKPPQRFGSSDKFFCGVSLSEGGQWLAAAKGNEPSISLWNVATGQSSRTLPSAWGNSEGIGFSPDGRWVACASSDKTVKLWNLNTGDLIQTLRGHPLGVRSVAVNRDSSRLASIGLDKTVRIWNTDSGQELLTISDTASHLAFSPNSNRLVTSNFDNLIKIWDMTNGLLLYSFLATEGGVTSLTFGPDGQQLVWGDSQGMIAVADAPYLSDEYQVEVQARSLLDSLIAKSLEKDEIIARIKADETVTEAVRATTLDLINEESASHFGGGGFF